VPQPVDISMHYDKQIKPEYYFKLRSGGLIRSIAELPSTLRNMSEDDFNYHCNPTKNDFAQWIRHVFHDEKLSDLLMPLRTRKEMIDFLDIFI
jgi:hypothetical protein